MSASTGHNPDNSNDSQSDIYQNSINYIGVTLYDSWRESWNPICPALTRAVEQARAVFEAAGTREEEGLGEEMTSQQPPTTATSTAKVQQRIPLIRRPTGKSTPESAEASPVISSLKRTRSQANLNTPVEPSLAVKKPKAASTGIPRLSTQMTLGGIAARDVPRSQTKKGRRGPKDLERGVTWWKWANMEVDAVDRHAIRYPTEVVGYFGNNRVS